MARSPRHPHTVHFAPFTDPLAFLTTLPLPYLTQETVEASFVPCKTVKTAWGLVTLIQARYRGDVLLI